MLGPEESASFMFCIQMSPQGSESWWVNVSLPEAIKPLQAFFSLCVWIRTSFKVLSCAPRSLRVCEVFVTEHCVPPVVPTLQEHVNVCVGEDAARRGKRVLLGRDIKMRGSDASYEEASCVCLCVCVFGNSS